MADEEDPKPCCPACGTYMAEYGEVLKRNRLLEDAQVDLQNSLTAKRAEVTRLKRDRNENLNDPYMRYAEQVYEHWRQKLAPKAREFTGKRLQAVLARLKAVELEDVEDRVKELLLAVDGCAEKPYVTERGRSRTGKPDERQAELELICRSDGHVMRFIGYLPTDHERDARAAQVEREVRKQMAERRERQEAAHEQERPEVPCPFCATEVTVTEPSPNHFVYGCGGGCDPDSISSHLRPELLLHLVRRLRSPDVGTRA